MKVEAKVKTQVEFKVNLELTENEARAFEALIGYGFKPFIEMFYKHMGKHYLQPYEKACENLFEQRQNINYQLYNIETAKKALSEISFNPGIEISDTPRRADPENPTT